MPKGTYPHFENDWGWKRKCADFEAGINRQDIMKSPYDMSHEEQVKEIHRLGWDACDLRNALRKYDDRSGFTTSVEEAIDAMSGDHSDRHRDTLKQYLVGYADALSLSNDEV